MSLTSPFNMRFTIYSFIENDLLFVLLYITLLYIDVHNFLFFEFFLN